MRDILLGFRRKRKMREDWGVEGTQTVFCGATGKKLLRSEATSMWSIRATRL